MSDFVLDPRLEQDSRFIADLPLCQVRLMNDTRYAWVLLIPRRQDAEEVFDLDDSDQNQLWREATVLGQALKQHVAGDKLNLATLGNVVSQLHMHVVVRMRGDDAWPGPIWGHGQARPYHSEAMRETLERLQTMIASLRSSLE